MAGLSRETIARRTREVLSRGGWGNPDVLLVDAEAGPVVVKDFSPRRGLVRRWIGPWLLRREEHAYRRLAGIAAVPRWMGWLDSAAIVLEYRPGVYLSRSLAGRLPPGFMADLGHAIGEMHRRGVVHLDLRHRSNVLAGEDGRPVVIDFASALRFDVATRRGRLCVRIFAAFDRRALRKWRIRLT
jgi:serine/threonine protein kinase